MEQPPFNGGDRETHSPSSTLLAESRRTSVRIVHEVTSASSFFSELSRALKTGGSILFVEPAGHVKAALWDTELEAASQAGFIVADRPSIRRSHVILLKKMVP